MKLPQLRKQRTSKNYHGITINDDYAWVDQPDILEVLKELGAEKHQMVVIMNKIDEKKAAKQLNFLKRKFPEGIYLSALNNLRINKLTQKIVDLMDKNFQTIDLLFSYKEAKEMSLAQKGVDVLERNYEDDCVRLKVKASRWRINQIQAELNK